MLGCEQLESRENPASITLSGGTLNITADYQSVVSITEYGGDVYVSVDFYDDKLDRTHLTPIYDADEVDEIVFNGGTSYDTYENDTAITDYVNGNDGNDILLGGSGISLINGGSGDDYIIGYAASANLVMVGQDGADGFHYRTGTRTQPYASEIYDYTPLEGDWTYA